MELTDLVQFVFRPKSNDHNLINKSLRTGIMINNFKRKNCFNSVLPIMDDFPNLRVLVDSYYIQTKVLFQFTDKRTKPSLKTVYAFSCQNDRTPESIFHSIRSVADKLLQEKKKLSSYGYKETQGFKFQREFLTKFRVPWLVEVFRETKGLDGSSSELLNDIFISFGEKSESVKRRTLQYQGSSMDEAVLEMEKAFMAEDRNLLFSMTDELRDALIIKKDESQGKFYDPYSQRMVKIK